MQCACTGECVKYREWERCFIGAAGFDQEAGWSERGSSCVSVFVVVERGVQGASEVEVTNGRGAKTSESNYALRN